MLNTAIIKALMAEQGHTQKDLRELLKLSDYGLRLKLKGRTQFKPTELKLIAELYGVTIDYFFAENIPKIAK